MLRTRTRKIVRDITSRKTRTLLVASSVFVGVLGVVVLVTLGQLITRQLEKDLRASEIAMLRLYLEVEEGATTNTAVDLARLRAQPDVTRVEGQAVYEFAWKLPGEPNYREGQLFAYSEPFQFLQLEPVRLRKGRYPTPGRNEIAVEQRMAEETGLDIGQEVLVYSITEGEQAYTVVGLVFQPYFYIGASDPSTAAFATYPDAQNIVGFQGFSSLYVRFTDVNTARQQSARFRQIVEDETPYSIVFYLIDDPQNNAIILGAQRFQRVLVLLALAAMIVSSFLVTNVISMVVIEQRRQIGAMKALGATRWDILRLYLGMALLYGLLGTIPALLAGIPVGQWVAEQAAPSANTILEDTSPPPEALGLGLLLGLGVPVLAAVVPVMLAAHVSILYAMSDWGIVSRFGRGLLPQIVRWLRIPTFFEQAINNVLRQRSRLGLTILTLAMAAATFMSIFAVFFVLQAVLDDIRGTLDLSEFDMLDIVQGIMTAEQEEVRSLSPGVAVRLTVADPDAETPPPIIVTGIDPDEDMRHIENITGTFWQDDPDRGGIVITEAMQNQFDKEVGDTLTLQAPDGEATFEIIGIGGFPLETAFMEWRQLSDFVGTIRDAPQPNAYWEQLQFDIDDNEHPLHDRDVWAVGIDEMVGEFMVPTFDPEQPGVILSQSLAEAGDYLVDDEVALAPASDDLLDQIATSFTTYPVLAIQAVSSQEISLLTTSAPPDIYNETEPFIIALYWAELAELVGLDYRTVSPTTFYIDLADPRQPILAPSDIPSGVIPTYSNQIDFADRIAQTIFSLGIVMNMASLLMAIVGGIGLLTITSIGVHERQREIGVMRSVGATSGIILMQYLTEGLIVGFVSWVLGVPLSYFMSQILVDAVPFREVIYFEYPPVAAFFGLVGVLWVTAAASLYPAMMASRRTVSMILRY